MDKDEVIALAEKCKLDVLIHSQWTHEIKEFTVVDYVVEGDLGSLMQFADLVAQHTLSNIDPSKFMSYQEGMEAGRLAEREACAKLCESEGIRIDASYLTCAEFIRARGTT